MKRWKCGVSVNGLETKHLGALIAINLGLVPIDQSLGIVLPLGHAPSDVSTAHSSLPGEMVQLHVFEPRYQMLFDELEGMDLKSLAFHFPSRTTLQVWGA